MGMFDSVIVQCPACGAKLDFQSKADSCELREYTQDSVPAGIAADIDGEIWPCECGANVRIRSSSPKWVSMFVEVTLEKPHD